MNLTMVLSIALAVFAEVEGDLKDGVLTVDELLSVVQTMVDKAGYGKTPVVTLGASAAKKSIAGNPTS